MLTVDISLQEKDYIAFSSFTQLRSPEQKKKSQKAFVIRIIFFAIILGVFAWSDSITSNYTTTVIYGTLIVLLTVVGKAFRKKALERGLKALYDQPDNDSLFERKEYTFSETGISVAARYTATQMKWLSIVKKIEIDGYIFLYTSAVNAMVLPLKYFNDWQTEALHKLLAQHLSFRADVGHAIAE